MNFRDPQLPGSNMKPVLILQNDANEGAGQLATLLAERGFEQQYVLGGAADNAKLDPDRFSALAVLGGAQGAYETEEYPYLLQEMQICRAFMEIGKPVAGFCLGAQLLACALGGKVVPNERKEIGWYDIVLTDAATNDQLMRDQPKTLLSYHFHGDFIEEAPGCTNLASSKMTECQLFRYGSNVYGFQYHAEVDEPLVGVMCRNNSGYLSSNGFDARTIIDESKAHLPTFERHCGTVLNRWLDLFQTHS
jgi:GMP synthase (glutamine-hydrolysing)